MPYVFSAFFLLALAAISLGSIRRSAAVQLLYYCRVFVVFCQSLWLWAFSRRSRHAQALQMPRFPTVFVPGLMISGHESPAAELSETIIVACLSPYASSHDRAVELFYMLKGGYIDYGEEHSCKYGHKRFGRHLHARLPHWSASAPIVLVAHSHGGNTARMLQHLLAVEFFDGYDTCAAWVKAIVCIAVPLNGLPVINGVGMPLREDCCRGLTKTGIERGQQVGRLPSLPRVGQTLGYLLHWGFGDFCWARRLYDWGLDHWSLTRKTGGWLALRQLLWGTHHILNTDDTAGYDLTVHGSGRLNDLMPLHSDTYYFSIPCMWTLPSAGGMPCPRATSAFFIVPTAALTAIFTPQKPPASFVKEWDYREWLQNDLVVPLRSQCFPCEGANAGCPVRKHTELWTEGATLERGIWHVLPTSEVDHYNVLLFPHVVRSKLQAVLRALK